MNVHVCGKCGASFRSDNPRSAKVRGGLQGDSSYLPCCPNCTIQDEAGGGLCGVIVGCILFLAVVFYVAIMLLDARRVRSERDKSSQKSDSSSIHLCLRESDWSTATPPRTRCRSTGDSRSAH